ncbi:muscle M-line assembly protein unc-89 isoform X2 [Teleopsis dalmanni]|uniref:muscle M-line assembly protein unc-89 isoform X2 n=1 Tax=Teleopsis dalmanni TaxID=139649 RepID=UPI0018CDD167|nr:muscle M-line assembly protein unc-89 isoform X2 [Teleopsis dalmanni]
MERHRPLDSSMSSLYSGSNISNTPSRQHENFNYQTMSSSVSPTPSGLLVAASSSMAAGSIGGGVDFPSATNVTLDGDSTSIGPTTGNGGVYQGMRATTIGTVVVRCGPIQLVIALLQSPEKIYIKVIELEPKITSLGDNLDVSLQMQREHDETLRNIQNLPGPMDEFVQKADKLLASKRISSELVNAMAETLNIIWCDILHLMEDRQHILHLCSQFQEKMTLCQRRMDQLEVACIDTMVPIEVPAVQEFLNKIKQLRIDMLTAVMAALKDGNELLAQLQELTQLETLDTRPEHIKRDATRAVHQVQQWLEALHDRRNALEIAWQTRKTQLEQCLALALLAKELDELEIALRQQRNEVSSMFSLGECEHTANNALHNYREWKQQALLLRDRALKITRAKEKLQASGTFTGDEACARAYNVLSVCTEHLDLVDQREHWLQQSREFFAKAEKTLIVLEKLEVELSNIKLPPTSPESYAMYAKVSRDVRNFTEEPLRLGYGILDEVGRTQPETLGVKRVLDEIENRKVYIESICAASNEDQQRVQKALSEFLQQYNDLLTWLLSSGQTYLQQHVEMGRSLEESKQFLLQHHELMQDLEIKGELINLLLESIKTHLESLSPQQRYDVDSKAETLHKHWIELKEWVLKRVDCVSLLIDFFERANRLTSQLDNLDRQLTQTPDQQKLQFLQDAWSNIRSDYSDLKTAGKRFITTKIVDPYLETKSSTEAVEEILNGFSKRQVDVTTSLENWTTHIAEKREVELILEKIMSDNEETGTKTTKLDTQIYPIFSSPSIDAKYLQAATRDKLNNVLKDMEKAQDEIQQRIHTTLAIQTTDQESQQKIEIVISNLRTLKSKLDGIKYDYKNLLDNILQFLENILQLRHDIDNYFANQRSDSGIERVIAEHEKFRDSCMDKFRSLITQSELLIDRVRALEPPGAREIDTDRILKLLENLRFHFETSNSERMSNLERMEKLEQFKSDLYDINRSLDSVSKQLLDINGQSVDSLAAAKTTSLAFEYFERTIELLEKRIDKFTETTSQQLYVSNPESEEFVTNELRKLNEKWQMFKEQVKSKRNSLNQATEFFEMVEKIEAEYREISYFYNSVANKITYLRDPIEAANLVNDIEKYVANREVPLREKLDNASKCAYDMNKVSTLYNDVMAIFQAFIKLKSDINIVQERLKNEERMREQREKEARDQVERERLQREAEARERAAREEEARLQALREQAAREITARELAIRQEEARLQAVREQTAREQAAREQAAREEEARLKALREAEESRLLALRERAKQEEEARLLAARQKAAREEEARLKALREEEARLQAVREQAAYEEETRIRILREEEIRLKTVREQTLREEEARLLAAREKAAREEEARLRALREEEARLRALREEEARLQAAREQAAREEEARLKALRDEETRLQAVRELAAREEETRLKILREEEIRLKTVREQNMREEEARLRAMREAEESKLQALREQSKREEESRLQALRELAKREEESRLQALRDETTRLQTARDIVDHQRIITENIRKDIQINEMFSEIKYASPQFERALKDAITREGDKIIFECEVKGSPEPMVEWLKDGISIQNNTDYKTSYNKGVCRLIIEETFAADSANYTCRASNIVGTSTTTANLSVRENAAEVQMIPPRFVRQLESGKAIEGSTYQFSCAVSGNPLPIVQWYKNDKCIDDSPDYIINYNNGEATLRFEEVFLEDDAVYTCSASNPAGIEHCSASLLVEPLEPTELPHFKIPLTNAMARIGQKIKLEALVGGIPQPDIFWLHNGKPYYPREIKYEYGRVTLIIPQAYPNDAGVYVLTAKNLAGEAFSSCNIIVKGRLPNETSDSEIASDMEPIKPSVQLPLKDVSIFEGKPVRLDCVIVGQPEPEVIWYHNDRPVKESADIQLLFQGDRCSLIIQEVYQEDEGNYKVVAINSAGETSSSCELKVTPLNIAEPATRAQAERQSLPKEILPKFEKFLTDVLVDENETVELEVVASGDQPLNAKWYLTNKELIENERISTVSKPVEGVFKLIIKNVNADDKGVYTIKVTNNAGDAKCFSHLNVKSVNVPENQRNQQIEIVEKLTCPEFKELFSDRNAYIDEVVKFECIVKGKPTPKIHWYFNDQPVHGHNFLVSTSGERQVLTIQKANTESVGKISCVAENEVGKASCIAFLNLMGTGLQTVPATSNLQTMTQEHNTESSRVTIKKQTFTTTSTSQVNSYEGNMPQTEVHHSSAHIDQSLKQLGNQRPEIMESHHYQELHKTKDMSSPSVQQKSFVLVQSASNGTTPSLPAVPASPTRIRKEIAPRFTTPLTGKIVDQGTDVSLEAIYDGFPSPEIKVEKNGEQLFENERMKIANKCNRVTIDLKQVGVVDAGRYAVTATNTIGQSTSTADLVVKKTIFPPVFGRRLQAQVVKRGEKIIMEVEVTGLPDPTVVWMKDDKLINEAGLSQHRLLSQGNSYKLIIEKGETSDSGKYMVKATNAGGEAKSIADCAVLEPSPERLQEVVKTIVYETPTELKTENFTKEPQSFQTNQSEVSTASDLHGLSESKIITEHRCTTEATMRLEHKSSFLDLPELSQRPKTPTTTNNNININISVPAHMDTTDSQHLKTVSTKIGSTQTPPKVPPKPHSQIAAIITQPQPILSNVHSDTTMMTTSSSQSEINTNEKTSSSFEYFKKIDAQQSVPHVLDINKKIDELPKLTIPIAIKPNETLISSQATLADDLKNLNLIPGSPPEICYIPKSSTIIKPPMINEKIKIIEESQQNQKEAPQGGVPLLPPPQASHTYKHESTMSKEVKVEYGQPIIRPAANLSSPAQNANRSPSPKPSAEGLAMSKLWTPNLTSGYESCTGDVEQNKTIAETKEKIINVQKLPTPTKELSAPFLVKQATKAISIPIPIKKETVLLDDIQLKPGTPPEICIAPKPEVRRQSLVEAMEKTLEQNLQQGPSKVLPMSVPTLTPATLQTRIIPIRQQEPKPIYKPPPPVIPAQITRTETYESDYESDRWKYSGSESDENTFRPIGGTQRPKSMDGSMGVPVPQHTFKKSGYAADTEDVTTYKKMESMQESRSYYESSNNRTQPQRTIYQTPHLEKQPPAPIYCINQNGHDRQEFSNEYTREEKDYKYSTNMSSNVSYNTSYATPAKTTTTPSPIVSAYRKTPAEFSDYNSEVEERFRSVSRTSETDIKGYRVVFPPTPTPKATITNGHKSPVVVVTPSPMEFEPNPPTVGSFNRPKFEPIKKEIIHEIKKESTQQKHYQQQQQQHVFKPKPVAAKFIAATQQQQRDFQTQQQAKPTLYYNAIAGTPLHTAKMATETKNVMHMKESSESCQRVVNMQQTKRVIHFDSQKEESSSLEPFPYTASPSRITPSRHSSVPPPPTPTKFIPGEFRESDYESEVENAKIRPLWTPYGDAGGLRYRHVEPPQPGRACSVPRAYERVLSPMQFDRGPEMPSKIQVDANSLRRDRNISSQNKTQSLNRHTTMRTSNYNQQYQSNLQEQPRYVPSFPRDDMNLRVGSPPKYGYIQTQADTQAKRMGSTFLQKSHQFIEDITSDLQKTTTKTTSNLVNGTNAEPKVITHAFRPGFKRAPSEGDTRPQAYRDESRVSQYVPELPSDIPVNAHLNRDEHPKKPPQFITPLKDIAATTGRTARFECIVQCHPQPNVTWSKNGYELEDSNKHILEYRNGVCRLTMPQAYPDDAGIYSCTAINPLGTATTSGQLLVSGTQRLARY